MRLKIEIELDADFYQLEGHAEATRHAMRTSGAVYTWKTTCRANWLERRLSRVDALGLVVLPSGLPDEIEMPDDPPDQSL